MGTRWETVEVQGKSMRCYLGTSDNDRPQPGIVIAMHGPGFDGSMFDVVHRLRRAGYASVLPDLYHRQPTDGMQPMTRISLLRDEEAIADMNAAAALLKSSKTGVNPIGVMGFCMGGRIAYLMSAANA